MSLVAQHTVLAALCFVLGTAVGSFLNVCIYRIPWQKSVIWPASCCPKCLSPIAARDNVPVLGWVLLGGKCRNCGLPISARYPMVEALVGLLFAGVYVTDVVFGPKGPWGFVPLGLYATAAYHMALIAFLVAATFIDLDLFIIPDAVPFPGMAIGLVVGTLAPWVRPAPAAGLTHWDGLWFGLKGWLIGGGIVWLVRLLGRLVFRREAMGFGDVTLMAMIGSFLGWQATVLTLFLGALIGVAVNIVQVLLILRDWLFRRQSGAAFREIPFGPYMSVAAAVLVYSWPWLWKGWAAGLFETYSVVFWYLVGRTP